MHNKTVFKINHEYDQWKKVVLGTSHPTWILSILLQDSILEKMLLIYVDVIKITTLPQTLYW